MVRGANTFADPIIRVVDVLPILVKAPYLNIVGLERLDVNTGLSCL